MAQDQDDLKNLKDLLRKLKSGDMRLVEAADVTQSKIGPLERDIAYLEERLKSGSS